VLAELVRSSKLHLATTDFPARRGWPGFLSIICRLDQPSGKHGVSDIYSVSYNAAGHHTLLLGGMCCAVSDKSFAPSTSTDSYFFFLFRDDRLLLRDPCVIC
jgi:hypothetical protein